MPRTGPGSIGRFGRRLAAVFFDWTACQLIAYLLWRVSPGDPGAGAFVPLGVFFVENILLVGTAGATLGHRVMGLGVRSVTLQRATWAQVGIRTLLLCLAVPALIWDRDGRGLHDKGAGTVLMRL
jgi:uncharacterized RDD family membrane protein YckC